jgi:hypothetical protein
MAVTKVIQGQPDGQEREDVRTDGKTIAAA